jgi:osomolarity two-component system response regulator SKN7
MLIMGRVGMNDILPKPFTQDGLLDMLEVYIVCSSYRRPNFFHFSQKHLMHLKVIQQMAQIPRSVGIPPLSDSAFEQALAVGASNNSLMAAGGSDETDNRINPLAGMGLTDEQYTLILQNMVNGESFSGVPIPTDIAGGGPSVNGVKRGLEEDEDGRDGKRGRFEVVE